MIDFSELKRLAEAARSDNSRYGDADCYEPKFGLTVIETAFASAATPAAVLALIAESERLSGECEGCPMSIAEELRIERDQLKAENEALRAALDNAAKGILWLQASVPMSLRISKRASKDYNAAKRAAMSQGEQL